jgi:hypothetical protein
VGNSSHTGGLSSGTDRRGSCSDATRGFSRSAIRDSADARLGKTHRGKTDQENQCSYPKHRFPLLSPNGKQGYIKKNTAAGAGEGIDYLPKKTIENDIHIR